MAVDDKSCPDLKPGCRDILLSDDLNPSIASAAQSESGVSACGTIDEAYHLSAGPFGCVIEAGGPRGALWAFRTLVQLLFPSPPRSTWHIDLCNLTVHGCTTGTTLLAFPVCFEFKCDFD